MSEQNTTNAIVAAMPAPSAIRSYLQNPAMIAELGKVLPKHCKPERMARVALTAITRTPKLAECDQASFFQALFSLSQWGLEPDGRRAHLVPFHNSKRGCMECQLILDYKGLVELAYRSPRVKNIHADVVKTGDVFGYNLGRATKHVPWFLRDDPNKPKAEGDVYAVYCQVELHGGTVKAEVMSVASVEQVRSRSRAANSGPWVTDWNEMAKKTVFKRLSKWIPLSAEAVEALEADNDLQDELLVSEAPIALPKPERKTRTKQVAESLGAKPAESKPPETPPKDQPLPAVANLYGDPAAPAKPEEDHMAESDWRDDFVDQCGQAQTKDELNLLRNRLTDAEESRRYQDKILDQCHAAVRAAGRRMRG